MASPPNESDVLHGAESEDTGDDDDSSVLSVANSFTLGGTGASPNGNSAPIDGSQSEHHHQLELESLGSMEHLGGPYGSSYPSDGRKDESRKRKDKSR